MLLPAGLRIFRTGDRIKVDLGYETAFRHFAQRGIDLFLVRTAGTDKRLLAVDELFHPL